MDKKDVVSIRGRQYDAQSGLPLSPSRKALNAVKQPINSSARSIHSSMKKSQTLVRRATQKPMSHKSSLPIRGRSMDIAKSSQVSRFGTSDVNHQVKVSTSPKPSVDVKLREVHPLISKMNMAKSTPTVSKPTSTEIKEQAIKEAIDKVPTETHKHKAPKKPLKRFYYSIFALALFVASIYVAYSFIPALSIRVAASQAGINATYPSFVPDGYSFKGPITYKNNAVTINYTENGGSTGFYISQTKSSWDSSAVKENIGSSWTDRVPSNFEEQGQTVYYSLSTGNTRAAWVNGGILYQISGDAKLDYDKIRRIVKSM